MNTTASMDLAVANTILEQLGGGRFVAMTGAKQIVGGPNHLQLKIGAGARDGINCLRIELDPTDTYTVKFYRIGRNYSCKVVKEIDGVYADDLRDLFTRETGFFTTL